MFVSLVDMYSILVCFSSLYIDKRVENLLFLVISFDNYIRNTYQHYQL